MDWQLPMNARKFAYCRTADGVRLAYAISGHGLPLVKPGNWLNHLEYDWGKPVSSATFSLGLSRHFRLIRHDPRGTGLSDWDVPDISLDAWVSDVAAVVDAAGVERFPLLGYSQGCAVAIAYAVRHPERRLPPGAPGWLCSQGGSKRTPESSREVQSTYYADAIGMGRRQPVPSPDVRPRE